MTGQSVIVGVVALAILGILGAYMLLNPNSDTAKQIVVAMLPVLGGIGYYFFHASQTLFLGQQLGAQRAVTVEAIRAQPAAVGAAITPPNPWAPAPTPSASTGSPPTPSGGPSPGSSG